MTLHKYGIHMPGTGLKLVQTWCFKIGPPWREVSQKVAVTDQIADNVKCPSFSS